MRVALVHDWLTGMRGGERCLEAFLRLYPEADIFTLVHVPGSTSTLIDARVKGVSFLNRFPGVARYYRWLLPLFPAAVRGFNLEGYDLIISLSHAAAKNITVPAGSRHVCYCFTPMRYIWDQARSYFRGGLFYALWPVLWLLRWWDRRGATRVDEFVAISSFVAARIRKFYGRRAFVIHPPVRMAEEIQEQLSPEEKAFFASHPEDFFLCAGALVPYKRVDIAVAAFNSLGLPLWVIGKGPELPRLRRAAAGNVRFLGHVSEAFMWECYRRCRALVFPGVEDFGIVPIECLASGRPVIGVDAGGLAETILGCNKVVESSHAGEIQWNGILIPKSRIGSSEALKEAVRCFVEREESFDPRAAKKHATCFSHSRFFDRWRIFCEQNNIEISSGVIERSSPQRASC